jgi:hypothetical protein
MVEEPSLIKQICGCRFSSGDIFGGEMVNKSEIPQIMNILFSFNASKQSRKVIHGIELQVVESNLTMEVDFLCISR